MHRTRIKICGITRADDAAAAVAAGADALGVVLAPSPRQITIEAAAAALADVPPLVARIGVFVDADADFMREAVERIGLAAVQFHGSESPGMCAEAPAPVIKAFRIGTAFDVETLKPFRGRVAAVLLDTLTADKAGGTGTTFDWQTLAALPEWASIIVAGGLHAGNAREAIARFRPFALDVSSGVETSPGIKDTARIEAFCAAVRAADQEVYS